MKDLIKIVGYLLKRQHILAEIVIHLASRADLYDDFVAMRFEDLNNLTAPKFKEVK